MSAKMNKPEECIEQFAEASGACGRNNNFLQEDDSLSGKSISSSSWQSAADGIFHMLSLLYQVE